MQTKEILLLPGCPANFRQRGDRVNMKGKGKLYGKPMVRDLWVNVQVQGTYSPNMKPLGMIG